MKKPRDIVKLRLWCMRRRGEGVSVGDICTAAQIPRRTFYNWWNRYRKYGPEGLEPRSRAPHTVHRIDQSVVESVVALRKERSWELHQLGQNHVVREVDFFKPPTPLINPHEPCERWHHIVLRAKHNLAHLDRCGQPSRADKRRRNSLIEDVI